MKTSHTILLFSSIVPLHVNLGYRSGVSDLKIKKNGVTAVNVIIGKLQITGNCTFLSRYNFHLSHLGCLNSSLTIDLQFCYCCDDTSRSTTEQMWNKTSSAKLITPAHAFHFRGQTMQQQKNVGQQNQMVRSQGSQYYKRPLSCLSHVN